MSNEFRIATILVVWVFFTSAAGIFDLFWQSMAWIVLSALLCIVGIMLIVDPDLDN